MGLKIENRQGEGEATISLFFDPQTPDELKVIFIGYVHRHLAKYGCDVTRDRRYVCEACGMPVTNLGAVRRRLAAGKDFITCQECDERVPLIDFIERRLEGDPVARKILSMDAAASRELDTRALEQLLIGHMMAVCGEANQLFHRVGEAEGGIGGEVEFKDMEGQPSGRKLHVVLKSDDSLLRRRRRAGSVIFEVRDKALLDRWLKLPEDVCLVVRLADEEAGEEAIRWMNLTQYLERRRNKNSRQIVFKGDVLDLPAVWRARDRFFPPRRG